MPDATGPAGKLALGTVQWGLRYGIAGQGQPDRAAVGEILAAATAAGIMVLDTAHAYGSAEEVLGSQAALTGAMRIVTKTLPIRAAALDAGHLSAIEAALEQSFVRLRRSSVYAILVHDAGDLLASGGNALWAMLERYRTDGRAQRIGVSVYNPEQCRAVAEAFPLDIVQLPFNIYDQRFLSSGALADLKARGAEIHSRSAFLQGLLMMPPDRLPPHFDRIRALHTKLHRRFAEAGTDALTAALHFSLGQPYIDRVVVGCETLDQFHGICTAAAAPPPAMLYSEFAVTDADIVEPSRWPK